MAQTRKDRLALAVANRESYFRCTKPNPPLPQPVVGETVAFSRYFLLQISADPTDDIWRARGQLVGLHPNGVWAHVHWQGEPEPRYVSLCHLARPGPNSRYCE